MRVRSPSPALGGRGRGQDVDRSGSAAHGTDRSPGVVPKPCQVMAAWARPRRCSTGGSTFSGAHGSVSAHGQAATLRPALPGRVSRARVGTWPDPWRPGAAEHVAADGSVEGWRRWDRVCALDRLGAWVRRVALRKAGRARWRRGRRRQLEASFESPLPSESGVDLDLVRALMQLSEAQRTTVTRSPASTLIS
jgi:hypothetical protein